MMCGKRWMINKDTSALGKWIEKRENSQLKAFGISS
jgi:hypothetical protein